MLISHLQDSLRKIVLQRISARLITGTGLARDTGFEHAHISNFIHARRGLSVEGFDRFLKALELSVADLFEPVRNSANSSRKYQDVPIVLSKLANHPNLAGSEIGDVLKFRRAFLRQIRPGIVGPRSDWQRFIVIKADAADAAAMYPRITQGSMLLIDRHYNTLKPYRRSEPNIYAVLKEKSLIVRYVEAQDEQLILRPASSNACLLVLATGPRSTDAIIGRVCHIGAEV
jgi:hypothetical protein